jgi:sulfotransferase
MMNANAIKYMEIKYMDKKFYFIAGLPRSGSTLLAAILRQNPRFYARMSSPLARMMSSVLTEMAGEDGPLVPSTKRSQVLLGLIHSFYADDNHEVVFDTNRGWSARLPLLVELFGKVRMICMVRNVASVMNSFEVLVQRNVFDRSRLFLSEKERLTVYSRAEALLLPDRTVGYALASLKEAFYGEHAHSLLFVEYDNLVKCPAQTLRLIYNFLDEKPYNHSFNAIEYDEPEFDASIATPGLHRIKESVRASPPLIVLPPDLCTMIEQLNFWRDAAESSSSSIIRCLYEDVKDVQDSNTKLVIERPIGTSSYPTTKKL